MPTKKLPASTIKRLAEFEEQKRRKRLYNRIGYTSALVGGMLLIMFLAGGYFAGVLRILGLQGISNQGTGLWVDCRKPENRAETYCIQKANQTEQDWDDMKRRGARKGGAFGLN